MSFRYTTGEEPPPLLQYSQGRQQQRLTPLASLSSQSGHSCSAESTPGGNTDLAPIVTAGYRNFRFGMGNDYLTYGVGHASGHYGQGFNFRIGMGNDYLNHGVGHPSGYYGRGFGWTDNFIPTSNGVQEEIQRCIEKERIREEIIAAEIARRRTLEAEVRAELKLERELAMRVRDGDAFDKVSYPMEARRPLNPRGMSFTQDANRLSLEERKAMHAEQRLRMRAQCETQGFDVVPFQLSRTINPNVENPTPSDSENDQQKEKIVFVAKPGADFSGTKRKAISPVEMSAKQLLSVGNTKGTQVWRCDICEVCTTSECGLNEHIQGKKHKAKEAALKKKENHNIGLGVLPNKKLKPVIEATHSVNMDQGLKVRAEALQVGRSEEESSLHDVSTQRLDANRTSMLPENTRNKKLKKVKLQKAPKSKTKDKKNFLFWCDMCQVGAKYEKVMDDHRNGKKHMRLFRKAVEKGQSILIPHTKAGGGESNASEATKEEIQASDNVDRTAKEDDVRGSDRIVIEKVEDSKAS